VGVYEGLRMWVCTRVCMCEGVYQGFYVWVYEGLHVRGCLPGFSCVSVYEGLRMWVCMRVCICESVYQGFHVWVCTRVCMCEGVYHVVEENNTSPSLSFLSLSG
jgi:hypothetical protein